MFEMIANKRSDCICAKEVGEEIQWFNELPEECNLDSSVKQAITPLLVGLLQVRDNLFTNKIQMQTKIQILTIKKNRLQVKDVFKPNYKQSYISCSFISSEFMLYFPLILVGK